ncbi:helix-turn-helix transcriptional regulator [Haloarchaeobius amylolyticus]|uniref:helix-turn-helix transcriptional regulator n=1 Tax=Haloarchaeobius amylolyticus TaxID=1198296 RepID=UPI00226E96F0|nr:helix-turn-helix domain-containing protein [Haloarchaeobius amylolyticus]
MRRSLGVGTLVLLVVGATILAGTGPNTDVAQAPTPSVDGPRGDLAGAQQFDRTQFQIQLYENGSARFAIHYERNLNESERSQFEEFAERFENNETELWTDFQRRAQSLVANGQNQTGREMTATAFQRRANIQTGFNDIGVVEMSFLWTGFASESGDRVVVGDVFEGGLYIGPSQSLVVQTGPNVTFAAVTPEGTVSGDSLATSDSVTWQGEKQFSDERPRIELVPKGTAGGTTAGGGDGDGGTTAPGQGGDGADSGLPLMPILLVVALVGVGGVVVWWRAREEGVTGDSTAGPTTTDRPAEPESPQMSGGAPAEPDPATDTEPAPEPAVSDEELLTDEDRVRKLLEDHGGRMRQSNIVDETDWSKSKVSMLLSDMEEEGDISKLRVGRENIVSLAGHEPDAAGSPFEDENDEGGER